MSTTVDLEIYTRGAHLHKVVEGPEPLRIVAVLHVEERADLGALRQRTTHSQESHDVGRGDPRRGWRSLFSSHREADVVVARDDLQLLLPDLVRRRPLLVNFPGCITYTSRDGQP